MRRVGGGWGCKSIMVVLSGTVFKLHPLPSMPGGAF